MTTTTQRILQGCMQRVRYHRWQMVMIIRNKNSAINDGIAHVVIRLDVVSLAMYQDPSEMDQLRS